MAAQRKNIFYQFDRPSLSGWLLAPFLSIGYLRQVTKKDGNTDNMSLINAQFSNRNVPEPATFGLLGLGLLGVTMSRRRATVSA